PEFKMPISSLGPKIKNQICTIEHISDSLTRSSRPFLLRHTFFVIVTRNDTAYFYKAKGDYMYKDYKNDVHY
ncbi:MAG TPA: hypothetical protein VL547_19305, partial [Dinghuibacter sp.]|uniref:hypothetical protein n=1 Tax=Dinghuibacter sp. TaxID=2024697 RepID=UPI002CB3507B